MGLIKEVFTELIDLPESATTSFDLERDLLILDYKANYAILNLLFQILDCLIIPYFTLALLSKNLDFIKIIIVLVLGFSSVFSTLMLSKRLPMVPVLSSAARMPRPGATMARAISTRDNDM